MRELPAELLTPIFAKVLAEYSDPFERRDHLLLVLARVCRTWRATALSFGQEDERVISSLSGLKATSLEASGQPELLSQVRHIALRLYKSMPAKEHAFRDDVCVALEILEEFDQIDSLVFRVGKEPCEMLPELVPQMMIHCLFVETLTTLELDCVVLTPWHIELISPARCSALRHLRLPRVSSETLDGRNQLWSEPISQEPPRLESLAFLHLHRRTLEWLLCRSTRGKLQIEFCSTAWPEAYSGVYGSGEAIAPKVTRIKASRFSIGERMIMGPQSINHPHLLELAVDHYSIEQPAMVASVLENLPALRTLDLGLARPVSKDEMRALSNRTIKLVDSFAPTLRSLHLRKSPYWPLDKREELHLACAKRSIALEWRS